MIDNIASKEERILEQVKFFDRLLWVLNNSEFSLNVFRNLIEEIGLFFKVNHVYLIRCRNINFWDLKFEWFSDKKYSKLYLNGNWENYLALYSYLGTGNHVSDDDVDISIELSKWKSQFAANHVLLIPILSSKKVVSVFGFADVEKRFFYDDEILMLKQFVNFLHYQLDTFEALTVLRSGNVELRNEVSELSNQLNLIPAMIAQKSSNLRYDSVNDHLIRIFGLRKFDVIGKTDIELFPKDIAANLQRKDLEAFELDQPTTNHHEISIKKKKYHFAYHRIPYRDRNDNLKKLLIVAHDITEMFSAKVESELASKAKSEFLANMSHELRTPLNSIIGFTELLLQDNLSNEQHETLSNIKQSSYSLLDLINDILDLNKIESGKFDLFPVSFNIRKQINEITKLFEPRVLEKGIKFKTKVEENVPQNVVTDPLRIRQILVNLIGNSLKFTKQGEINLVVRNVPSNLLVENFADIEYSVTDTGIGIAPEKLNKIFEAFTQAEKDTAQKFGGTGLGLTISKRLIEMMGGSISVSSELDVGSRFWFKLPVEVTDVKGEKVEVVKEEVAESIQIRKPGEPLILVVDDDISTIRVYENSLKSKKYNLLILQSGKDVLSVAKKHRPDAILLDIFLPEKNGWEVLRELKSDVITKSIPVIVCSILQEQNKALNLGAADYIEKPIAQNRLLEILTNIHKTPPDKKRIVVVDDDVNVLKRLDKLLDKNEYFVECFSVADMALDNVLKSSPPSLIILDLMMERMDGFEFIKELRRSSEYNKTPVLVITARELNDNETAYLREKSSTIVKKSEIREKDFLKSLDKLLTGTKTPLAEVKPIEVTPAKSETQIPSLNVLLVEDNLMNQKFMSHILKRLGSTYDIAVDGRDCLDKLNGGKYDLILMDIQMPVMDGIEATKAIRQDNKYKYLPIIALTAHAMKGDRERCLAAGCNGYITKPVDQQKLVGEIMTVIKTTEPEYEEISPYFQGFDKEEVIQFQTEYIEQLRTEISELDRIMSPKEFEKFKFFGHNIKGNGVAYGFPEVSKLGAQIENSSKDQDYASLSTAFEELKEWLKNVKI
ncbi:MAG: response regulator [Ignavibacteria bacterium]|nr:response regulator [Ignavibacteria bacterium]